MPCQKQSTACPVKNSQPHTLSETVNLMPIKKSTTWPVTTHHGKGNGPHALAKAVDHMPWQKQWTTRPGKSSGPHALALQKQQSSSTGIYNHKTTVKWVEENCFVFVFKSHICVHWREGVGWWWECRVYGSCDNLPIALTCSSSGWAMESMAALISAPVVKDCTSCCLSDCLLHPRSGTRVIQ